MQAALLRQFNQPLSIEEVNLRPVEAGEVRIRLAACSICHSDLSFMRADWSCDLPALLGHEAAGTVIEAGPDAGGYKPGDRVVASLVKACGHCASCLSGLAVACISPPAQSLPVLTDHKGEAIWQGMNMGAFAEEILVHHHQLVPIPDHLPFERACLLACGVITGWGSVRRLAQLAQGAKIAVIGAGGIGLNIIQAGRMAGAGAILALDVAASKQEAARTFGATHFADPSNALELDARLAEMQCTGGLDAVFVAVGRAAAIEQGLGLCKPGGSLVIAGMPATGDLVQLDAATLAASSQTIKGSKMGATILAEDIPELIGLWDEGQLDLDALVSHQFDFADINEALVLAASGQARRIVLTFGQS